MTSILHLYKAYPPIYGGIEGHIQALAEAQAAAGHSVTVLVTRPGRLSTRESLRGVEITRAAAPVELFSTPLSFAYFRLHASLKPDIAHVHSFYPPGELAAWRGKVPYVLTLHAEVTRPAQQALMWLYRPIWSRVIQTARQVIVTSPGMAASRWLSGRRPVVIPLGVDPARFVPSELRRTGDRPPTLLFVGRLRHYKGIDVLLRALSRVPGCRLIIAGDGPEAPLLAGLTQQLGLRPRVEFLGDLSPEELPHVYQRADLAVLPAVSRAEAFGVVLLEAMASGLPCITTELGTGTTFVVRDGETGLVVPPRDEAALAQAIARLCADPELRQRMGSAGRERILAEFTHSRMIESVSQVYAQIL